MARLKQQCPTCKDWYAHGFCGNCERVLTDVQPLDVGELIKREGWFCTSCGHRHAGPTLANICVGCSCPVTEHTTAEDDWIRIASENAKDATARLEAMRAERDKYRAALQEIADMDLRFALAKDMHSRAWASLQSPVYPTAIHALESKEEIITIDEDGTVSANGQGLGPIRDP